MKLRKAPITSPKTLKNARTLRRNQTPAEIRLWAVLRNRQANGLKFRRQVPLGSYIADFYCHAANVVVEVDGDTHAESEGYDRARTAWLESQGIRVIRFTNHEVMNLLNDVMIQINEVCNERIQWGAGATA